MVAKAGVVAAGLALVIGGLMLSAMPSPEAQPRPDAVSTSAPIMEGAGEPEATGVLEVPGVVTAPLLHMSVPADGVLDPASWWDFYLVDGYGSPSDPDSGTVFVAAHSGRGSTEALGDVLEDRVTGKPALEVGSLIIIDGVKFEVTGSRVAAKGQLSAEADLWDSSHDAVITTCQQFADNRPSSLALIFAKRA